MVKFISALFVAIIELIRNLVIIGIVLGIGMLIAKYLCNIDPQEEYSWIFGIWHGLFYLPNYIRALFSPEISYTAVHCSTMYKVFYTITIIPQVPIIIGFFYRIVILPIMAALSVATDK